MRLRNLGIRALLTWAIETLALVILAAVLPDVTVADWRVGIVAVLVIAALNALVRPVLILLAINLGVVPFAIIALLANAIIVLLAGALVPGFQVTTLASAFALAFGLAILNALVSSLLGINDEDSFYRNVIRWAERRQVHAEDLATPGTILVQIDGLAEWILRSELQAKHLPTLSRWLATGSHRLIGWECDIPSMTSSGQAGILYGNNANIPAFRWYDRSTARLLVSNHPRDAHLIDTRQATEHGLLRDRGSSVGNIFAGGAEHCVMTMSRLTSDSGQLSARTRDLYDYFVNPYNLYRAIGAMAWEVVVEIWEAQRQRLKRVEPRMNRGGMFPLMRAGVTVLLRDITTWMLVADIFAARHVTYADYLGYDEVAHHAGPATEDARRVLRKVDSQLRQLEVAARRASRRYEFVVLSDHGQSTGATFRQRYGTTLEGLVHALIQPELTRPEVVGASGNGEGEGQVHALLADTSQAAGAVGRGARTLLARIPETPHLPEPPDVVVCASGNLAHIYFARQTNRVSLEWIGRTYPRLLDGLVQHPGIGFVMVQSDSDGPLVLGPRGQLKLQDGIVSDDNPLDGFSSNTARFLRRLATYRDVGDIVVNSLCEPETQQVAAFEELIGCHGGAGGAQTRPFVMYPCDWSPPSQPIVGAETLHAFLRAHIDAKSSVVDVREGSEQRQVV